MSIFGSELGYSESRSGRGHFMPGYAPSGAPPAVYAPAGAPPAVPQRMLTRVAAQPYPMPQPTWQPSQGQLLKRQDEMRRMREREMQRRDWRGRPQVTNIYQVAPTPPSLTTAPATTAVVVPPSMPAPQPNIAPGSNTADMGPTQDAAAASADASLPAASPGPGEPGEHPVHKFGRPILIALVVGGVAFGGYKLYQKHKKGGGGHAPAKHGGMQGYRRRRRR